MKTLILGAIGIVLCASLALGQDAIPLEQAIKDGKVEVAVSGIGGSTGDVILLALRRKVAEPLRLTLTPGTVFHSVSSAVQNMAGASIKGERVSETSYRPASDISLADNDQRNYVVEAYCLDFHKDNPSSSSKFLIAPADGQVATLLALGKDKSASVRAIQAALWMVREHVSLGEIQGRFRLSADDIAKLNSIIPDIQPQETVSDSSRSTKIPDPWKASELAVADLVVGDGVVTTAETALKLGPEIVARVPSGTQFRVKAIRGNWIGVLGTVSGKVQDGWVEKKALKLASDPPINDVPPEKTLELPTAPPSDDLRTTQDLSGNGELDLVRRVAKLEKQVADLQRANKELINNANDQSVTLGEIARERTSADGKKYFVPNVQAISSDKDSRRQLVDVVVHDMARPTGDLKIHNQMGVGQSLVINGVLTVYVPANSDQTVTVPAGTATTELAGEGVKSWAIGAPTYSQDIVIAPARPKSATVAWQDPLTGIWYQSVQ